MLSFITATVLLVAPTASIDDGTYPTFWVHAEGAHERAKKSRTGILYWFPVKGTSDLHEIFQQESMNELSRRIIVVNVDEKCHSKDELRKQYQVPPKYPTFVLCDYHGNTVSPNLVLRKGLSQKVDPTKHFEKPLKNVQNWIDRTRAKIKKDLAKVEKDLSKKKFKRSVPRLLEIVEYRGFPEVDRAREVLFELVDRGKKEIRTAEKLDRADAIKALKKVVKNYKGTEVEPQAKKALEKLESGATSNRSRA